MAQCPPVMAHPPVLQWHGVLGTAVGQALHHSMDEIGSGDAAASGKTVSDTAMTQ